MWRDHPFPTSWPSVPRLSPARSRWALPWCLGTGKPSESLRKLSSAPGPAVQGVCHLVLFHLLPFLSQVSTTSLLLPCPVWPGIQPFVISGVPGTSSLAGSSDLSCPGQPGPELTQLSIWWFEQMSNFRTWTPPGQPSSLSTSVYPKTLSKKLSLKIVWIQHYRYWLLSACVHVCVCACVGDLRL